MIFVKFSSVIAMILATFLAGFALGVYTVWRDRKAVKELKNNIKFKERKDV